MKYRAILGLFGALFFSASALADDFTVLDSVGATKTFRSQTNTGVELPFHGLACASGVTAWGTAGSSAACVLSIQGIASGTAMPISGTVTVTGVATAAKQPALGTAGTASADVITIQGIASMTKILVTPDSVALPANQSVNVAQINGVATTMDNGASGTGVQRVTIANNSTGILASIGSITTGVVPGVAATSLGKTEDAAHTTGDTGVMSLCVRNDTNGTPLAGTSLDYIPCSTTPDGSIRMSLTNGANGVPITSFGGGTQFAEDVAHTTGDVGTMALAVRRDTPTSLAGTDNDYLPMTTDSLGRLWVNDGPLNTAMGTIAASVYAGSGDATAIGVLKGIYAAMIGDVPSVTGPLAAATAAATKSLVIGGQYLSTQPTMTNTQQAAALLSARGELLVAAGVSGLATNATLAAETTKVIGTVNQGTSPWVTTATLAAETTKVIGTVNQGTSPWVTSVAADAAKGQSATGSAAPSGATLAGARSGANMVGIIQANAHAIIAMSTATTTEIIAASGATVIYVTGYDFLADGTGTFKFVRGTGTNCGTGTTDVSGTYRLKDGYGISRGGGLGPILVGAASGALCVTSSAAININGTVSYTQF